MKEKIDKILRKVWLGKPYIIPSIFNFFSLALQFSRWSLLGAGVLYGIYHQNRLSKRETINRKIAAERKVIRDAELAVQKKIRVERNYTTPIHCISA